MSRSPTCFFSHAFHSQKTKLFETTRYTILFFGSPAQGDGSSVKKLCEEVGKNFKPRLGRSGRASSVLKEATESRPQSHEAGREAGLKAGLEAGEASIYRLNLKVTRQAARQASRQARQASRQASRHEASASVQGSKALRQASVASLGHGLQAEQRRTNEARHKRPLANKNDSCGI